MAITGPRGKARRGDLIIGTCWWPGRPGPAVWPFVGFHLGRPTNLLVNNQDAVRVGDLSLHTCPGVLGIAITGALTDLGSLVPEHRLGELVLPIGMHVGIGVTVGSSTDSLCFP